MKRMSWLTLLMLLLAMVLVACGGSGDDAEPEADSGDTAADAGDESA